MRWEDFASIFDKLDVCAGQTHLRILKTVPRKHEHLLATYKRWVFGQQGSTPVTQVR